MTHSEENPESGRRAEIQRQTRETEIEVLLDLDGGDVTLDVPSGFFSHMLEALAKHGGLGLRLRASADTHVDLHHMVEDTGICLGEALVEALGDRRGLLRFGHAYAPLDEALVRAVVDLSGRGFFSFSAPPEIASSWVTVEFPLTLLTDFFQAFADRGRFTLHLHILEARNPHHAAEAAFKAVALALREAITRRRGDDEVPSTKGTLIG